MFRLKSISIVLVLVFMVLLSAKTSYAQSPIGPGIDLIILVDQSGSMSAGITPDDPAQPKIPPTDPEQRRIYTAQYLVDYMTFDNLYINPNRTNRVVVIGFGSADQTRLMVPLTALKKDMDVQATKEAIKSEMLGNTSFLSAFQLVRQQFPPSADQELANGLRRRLIVAITDGGPCDPCDDKHPMNYNDYFANKLGSYYKTNLGPEQYPVYVIGIDKSQLYWKDVKNLWEDYITGKGHAVRVESVDEINARIVEQICPFLNATTGAECRLQDLGDHFVPPYARYVSFSFFKYSTDAQITLSRPKSSGVTGGTEVQKQNMGDVKYAATPRDQQYVIDTPAPGCWRSAREGAGKVDVFIQVFFNDILMTKPSSAHPSVAPLDFEFSLRDAKGNPVSELKDFPLAIDAKLTGPDGRSQDVAIQLVSPGVYASKQGALTSKAGVYTLTLAGTTAVPSLPNCRTSGGTYPIFTQTFQVPVYTPKVVTSEPEVPFYHYGPLTGIAVQFTDDKNNPLVQPINPLLMPELAIESPEGRIQALGNVRLDKNVIRSDAALFLPETGIYTVTALLRDPSGNQVFKSNSTFSVVDSIETIRPGPNYPAFAPLRFVEIELRDKGGQPAVADSNYPLRVEANMIWPDGISNTIQLEPTGRPGRYRAPADWKLTAVAPHTLEISAYSSLLPGSPEEKVFISHKTINVSGNLPFYRVTVPDEENQRNLYPLHRWYLPPLSFDFTRASQPIQVELRYGNQLGQAKDFFMGDPNSLFRLTVVDATGKTIIDQRPLRDRDGRGSVFAAELPELVLAGDYTATIVLAGQVRGGVTTQGAWTDATVPFQRADSIAYLVIWILLGIVLVAAVLYFGGGFALNRFLLPKAKGKLIAETTGIPSQSLWEFPITSQQRNHLDIKESKIDARLGIKRIQIRRADPQKRRGKDGREEVEEGVEITAYNDKDVPVATGKVYKSRPNQLPVRQKTSENQNYRFRYED